MSGVDVYDATREREALLNLLADVRPWISREILPRETSRLQLLHRIDRMLTNAGRSGEEVSGRGMSPADRELNANLLRQEKSFTLSAADAAILLAYLRDLVDMLAIDMPARFARDESFAAWRLRRDSERRDAPPQVLPAGTDLPSHLRTIVDTMATQLAADSEARRLFELIQSQPGAETLKKLREFAGELAQNKHGSQACRVHGSYHAELITAVADTLEAIIAEPFREHRGRFSGAAASGPLDTSARLSDDEVAMLRRAGVRMLAAIGQMEIFARVGIVTVVARETPDERAFTFGPAEARELARQLGRAADLAEKS